MHIEHSVGFPIADIFSDSGVALKDTASKSAITLSLVSRTGIAH